MKKLWMLVIVIVVIGGVSGVYIYWGYMSSGPAPKIEHVDTHVVGWNDGFPTNGNVAVEKTMFLNLTVYSENGFKDVKIYAGMVPNLAYIMLQKDKESEVINSTYMNWELLQEISISGKNTTLPNGFVTINGKELGVMLKENITTIPVLERVLGDNVYSFFKIVVTDDHDGKSVKQIKVRSFDVPPQLISAKLSNDVYIVNIYDPDNSNYPMYFNMVNYVSGGVKIWANAPCVFDNVKRTGKYTYQGIIDHPTENILKYGVVPIDGALFDEYGRPIELAR